MTAGACYYGYPEEIEGRTWRIHPEATVQPEDISQSGLQALLDWEHVFMSEIGCWMQPEDPIHRPSIRRK